MECFAGDVKIEGDDVETIAEDFVVHARDSHDWPYAKETLRNYARNFAEATARLTGETERLAEIGEVAIHPVSEARVADWLQFFDHEAFAGNPSWASCYCLEPHVPAPEESPERPWREVRAAMVHRLNNGGTYGYLAYVDGTPAGWANASLRVDYGMYRNVDSGGANPDRVVGVSCFIIAPPYRRHGLAATLLDRVIDDAADRGAKWVEGYPYTEPDGDDPSHYRGPKHIYRDRGFEEVEQHDGYLVMRRAT